MIKICDKISKFFCFLGYNGTQIKKLPNPNGDDDDDNGVVESIRREYRSMLSGPDTFVSGHNTPPRVEKKHL